MEEENDWEKFVNSGRVTDYLGYKSGNTADQRDGSHSRIEGGNQDGMDRGNGNGFDGRTGFRI